MKIPMQRATALALAIVAWLAALFGYYSAADVDAFLQSDDTVTVSEIREGRLFDGPGERDALIFYPGAKVEAAAYAPLLRKLAENGVDCFLVEMPLGLAIFGVNKADRLLKRYDYDRWYLAGHSLGGAMAAQYAAKHADALSGLFLLGAYTATDLTTVAFPVVYLYGTEDGVINRTKLEKGVLMSPLGTLTVELDGGNHAQFGLYGPQKGDGEATISAEAQQTMAANEILRVIKGDAPAQPAAA